MSTEDSVSRWIDEIRLGKDELAGAIWERYFPQLVRVARHRLNCRQDPVADEEDIALSVLESFFEGAQNNRFPNLRDRDGLWRLLSEMTRRKAIDYLRRGQRLKRGGRPTVEANRMHDDSRQRLTSCIVRIDAAHKGKRRVVEFSVAQEKNRVRT
jgi:DNA-directed RNA polymerase specialized sigma24 family protein